jgi:hypothetical protein
MSNVHKVDCSSSPAALRAALLERADAHPVWHTYLVSLVHLRPVEGVPPAVLTTADSTHEILIQALDPDSRPDPDDPSTFRPLMPPNLAHQLRGRTDEVANDLFAAFVQALSTGELSPDTDYRSSQIEWLSRWGKAS